MLHVAFASLCAGHTASVRSLTFTSDSHQLLTASDDRTIRVYVPHSVGTCSASQWLPWYTKLVYAVTA